MVNNFLVAGVKEFSGSNTREHGPTMVKPL